MTELDCTQVIRRKPYHKIGGYWHGSAGGNWGLACVITLITLVKALVWLGFFKGPFKKSCHHSTGSTMQQSSSAAPQQAPTALSAHGKEGALQKAGLEQRQWVFLPRLFTGEGNAMH